jgi:hypothetical protein
MRPRLAALLAAALASPALAQAPAPKWQPRTGVELQALDKISARTSTLTADLNQPMTFGSLTIVAKSCFVHPPDQPQDAAAWLDITDSHSDQPNFHGWMLASTPSVSSLEHPVYDVRLTGCR